MTKEALDSLRAEALRKHSEYMDAEKSLWCGDGLPDMAAYKAFKKAKAAFHNANQKWENALLDYINGNM